MFDVTVAGDPVEGLIDVSFSGEGTTRLGTAEVEVQNTEYNRSFSFGDEVLIARDGERVWSGYLERKPSAGRRNLKVTLSARDKREVLQYVEVHRPFHAYDSGEIIREAVESRTEPRDPVSVFDGSSTTGFASDIPVFELADISSQSLGKRGSDLLFGYWREGASGRYEITYSNVPSSAAAARRLLWFETRFLFNNVGDYFTGEVEFRDNGGNAYVWDLDIPTGATFAEHRYNAEEASGDGSLSTNGTLQYRIDVKRLPEPRAAVIDYARVRPFSLASRDTPLSTTGVRDTDRTLSRRFDATVLELIEELSVEDGAISYIDENDTLYYEPEGYEDAPESISYASTRVVDMEIDRDATDIVNKVVAQGEGTLQNVYQNTASINFYGVSERERPLVNTSIQSEAELEDYAAGYLNANAWDDTAMSFTVADEAFRSVRVGQSIYIEWTPENIGGYWTVTNTETDGAGRVTIAVSGHGG